VPKGDRYFAENGARKAPAQCSLDTVEQLDDLDPAAQNRVERALATFSNDEFSGTEMQIGGGVRETLELRNGERREQRYGADVVNGQHGWSGIAATAADGLDVMAIGIDDESVRRHRCHTASI
jgi:hypothetical protein